MMSLEQRVSVYDLLGIGFGPSNLALAIALEEHNRQVPTIDALSAIFFEKQQQFGWHRGMLIDGASMQVSFLKDLVTLRNPSSEFSFLSYLHSEGRLVDFVNHKTFFPSRIEFHDYLEWAADRFDHLVEYGCEVIEVKPVWNNGAVVCFDVVARRGDDPAVLLVQRARNLVIALGLQPRIPPGVVMSERVWHNHDLLTRLKSMPCASPRRVTVVGAGQSAAEVIEYLHRRFPEAEVCAVFSRYGYTPADDSCFANRIFDPQAVDFFFVASDDVKRMLFDYHRGTNYSAVDTDLIDELYRRVYQEKVQGEQRLRILNASRITDVQPTTTGVRVAVEFLPTGETTMLDSDILVYATGYCPANTLDFLGPEAGGLCLRDHQGRLRIERDYRVCTPADVQCGIYIQGATEYTHGISSTLLSNTAIRAGEILQSIAQHSAAPVIPHPSYALTADHHL
jgi:L-ornithine N5-monooxygenase